MTSSRRPLDGVRVTDVSTGPVGGLATMVLADFGADVIKLEPPGGDRFRALPSSPLWLRGKRSVVLDLGSEQGLRAVDELVRRSDVVLVAGPPSRTRRWRLDAASVTERHPGVVHCSVTGWGERGPLAEHPAYPQTVSARAGRMLAFAGQVRRPGPAYTALPVAVHAAAHGAVQGIVSALIARERGLAAGPVRTSLLQGLLPHDLVELLWVELERRTGNAPRPLLSEMPTLNYHPVLAADGRWIQCGNLLEHLFLSFLDAIDLLGELLLDSRFRSPPALWPPDAVEHARDRILERIRERPSTTWMEIFAANGNVAAEVFRTPGEALGHPDLLANGSIVTLDDARHGPVAMAGPIARLTLTPARIDRRAPLVGEHTGEVLSELSSTPRDRTGGADGKEVDAPLRGITVVEFAAVIAAPLGASMLADLGARVIRVEPMEGDSYRHLYPQGTLAAKTTAGKESICLDLKRAEGREIARALVAKADVLVHNYRPGVPERLGIGFEELRREHPGLVWVSVNGYGPDGPGARRPATHPIAGAAMGGAGYQAGVALTARCSTLADIREASRQIMRANDPNPDPNTSAIVASATLLALLERQRSGEGQAVFVDMLTANAHANADAFLRYGGMAPRPALDPMLLGTGPLDRLYETAAGWVMLTITTDAEWDRFRLVAEVADLARVDRGSADVEKRLAAVLMTRTAEEWEALCTAQRVAVVSADAMTPGNFVSRDEHVGENGFAPEVQHARFGTIKRWGALVTVGASGGLVGPGVLAGQHTDAILRELGHTDEAIAALRAAGVVGSEPVQPQES
jgi:crotonobetainyl-CoA:carnitine CoA-transferase CaiB-like acyl-CoA transferase